MLETNQPLWVSLSASAIRTLPFGRYHLSNAIAKLSSGPFVARLPRELGGARFICDLQDSIAREVCFTGRYEPQETQLAARLLAPGMCAVDVGANWGYFSLVCAHLVGRAGRVVALEPHPRLAAMLGENVRANNLSQVDVRTVAAGADRGPRAFVGFDERAGNWGLSRAARPSEASDFECATTSLDTLLFADGSGKSRVDLVKMDIEGGEAEALEGMARGLAGRRYRYVLLECHPAELARIGQSVERCLEPFVRAGYRGWHIDHSPAMHRRAAIGPVPIGELLTPIDPAALGSDPWPHLLWAAPSEPLPA
jgi:FkbM family methyltransferase